MNDKDIIQLYLDRNQRALSATVPSQKMDSLSSYFQPKLNFSLGEQLWGQQGLVTQQTA